MGDILSAFHQADIQEYLDLCRIFNEEVEYLNFSPDCYGPHAESLRARAHHDSIHEEGL